MEQVAPVATFQPMRVILIGLGGIGSKLAEDLARYMMYEAKAPKELVLVDGDVYSESNLDRQSILEGDVGRPKAQVWAEGLAGAFPKLVISGISGYVVPDSMRKENTVPISKLSMEGAVTILAVDNHKTRKMFSDHFQKGVQNGVLINGGNNMTDGSLITAIRMSGEQITPSIDAFHPEIAEPKDKNPGELSCAELAKVDGGTQVIWANKMVATLIGNELYCVVQGELEKLRARGEVYFDIMANAAAPRQRFVPGKEVSFDKGTVLEPAASTPSSPTAEGWIRDASSSLGLTENELLSSDPESILKALLKKSKKAFSGAKVVSVLKKPRKVKLADKVAKEASS